MRSLAAPLKIGDERQAIVRLQVGLSELNDLPLATLQQEEALTILLHARSDAVNIPPDIETRLQAGDEIVVMATEEKLEALNRRNSHNHLSLST